MADDFRVRVIAETQEAEKRLKQVDDVATKATQPRNIKIDFPSYEGIRSNFTTLQKDIKSAANDIKQFYQVASKLPVGPLAEINEAVGNVQALGRAANDSKKSFGDAGAVIRGTLESTGRAAENLVAHLTRIAFTLYAINEAAKITQSAFSGLFSETLGREIQLRETILKAQTTLASTNKVFANGKEITDPYQKIVALTGAVAERIDSIRERSIALAGVTSNEVIEVFGIVASQVGQIGGGLKEAEDLAINFAAALGTFGIPLYQAQQEIGSILRGDITTDSYLARALGITNEDVARAKSQTGGVVKFLEDRLAAAVAGQRIAAEGFAGVVSNIKDLSELINQNFGRGLLDPLIDGLTKVFNFLFNIRKELFGIASVAGESLGKLLSIGFGRTLGASGGFRRTEGGGGGAGSRGTTATRNEARVVSTTAAQVLTNVENLIKRVSVEINKALSTVYLQLATLTERAANAFGSLVKGLTALALGLLSLQLEKVKALVGAVEAVSPALLLATKAASGFLAVWGEFLRLPVVQEISQISANMRLLQITGVMPLIKNGFLLQGVIENWAKVSEFAITQFNKLRVIIGGLIAGVGSLAIAASEAGRRLLAAWQPSSVALQALKAELQLVVGQLTQVGAAAQAAGSKIGSLNTEVRKGSGGVITLITNFIKFNLLMFAISAILSLTLERFGAWKEAQDKIASDKRAEEALRRLQTTYKDVGGSADEATKRAKAFEESLVNAKYDEAVQNLEDIRKKLAEIQDLTSGNKTDLGDYARRIAQLFNPANFDAFLDRRPGELFSDTVYRKRLEQEKKAEADKAKWASEINKQEAERNLQLEAQNRVNLEREITDLRRQLDNDLFQQRQALAQKEVEIFRAAGELRIQQIEKANAKLLEGEEGASRAALEALDNYISTRERGELEIESAKKTIAIEVTNLEKAISDYRLDIERKIADLRKKSADYEKNAADARARAAGSASGAGNASALSQLIGSVESFGGDYGAYNRGGSNQGRTAHGSGIDPNLVNMTIAEIQRRQLAPGVPAGQQLHAVGKYQIIGSTLRGLMSGSYGETGVRPSDKFSPENQEKLFAALARHRVVPGDESATMRGLRQEWVGLQGVSDAKLRAAIAPLMGGGAPATGNTPASATSPASELPDSADAAARYAEAVRSVAGAMERLRSLQAAITEAKTAEAFERIAKAAFPQLAIEQYQDQLTQLRFTYDAVSTNAASAFDPERTALEVERLAKIAISNRELAEIKAGIAAREKLSEDERKRAMEGVRQRHADYLRQLERESQFKQLILTSERATAFIQESQVRVRDIEREIEALQTRNRMQAEGFAPEFIEAELAKLDIRRRMNELTEQLNTSLQTQITLRDDLQKRLESAAVPEKEALQRQLDAANAEIAQLRKQLEGVPAAGRALATAVDARARAQTEPGTRIRSFIGEAERSLKDYESMAIQVSQSVGDAVGNSLANGISGLIEGTTTAKEVFAGFLKDVGRILIQQATSMIAIYTAIGIARMFAFGSSGVSGGAGGAGASDLPAAITSISPVAASGAYFANGIAAFANGGTFTNSVVSSPTLFQFADGGVTRTGLMGEAGPEAIMPLERGPDGKLGIAAHFSENRQAMKGGSSGEPASAFSENRDAINATATVERERMFERVISSGASSTEIKYSRVGSGDLPFVTEEDMLQASRIAAQEGARLGQQRTLAALKNNPAARRSVGI